MKPVAARIGTGCAVAVATALVLVTLVVLFMSEGVGVVVVVLLTLAMPLIPVGIAATAPVLFTLEGVEVMVLVLLTLVVSIAFKVGEVVATLVALTVIEVLAPEPVALPWLELAKLAALVVVTEAVTVVLNVTVFVAPPATYTTAAPVGVRIMNVSIGGEVFNAPAGVGVLDIVEFNEKTFEPP